MDLAESRIKAANNGIEATLEGVRNEMNSLQKDVTASIREVESNGRANEKDVRNTMRETETRIDEKMRIVEKDLKEILQEALALSRLSLFLHIQSLPSNNPFRLMYIFYFCPSTYPMA